MRRGGGMTGMTNFFDKTRGLALVVTGLAAVAGCDEGEVEAEFGAGDTELRCPGCSGGVVFNTFAWGLDPGGELDSKGALWADARLVKVELRCGGEKEMWRYPAVCAQSTRFKLDRVWAEQGELFGTRDGKVFRGADFLLSDWTIDLYKDGLKTRTHLQTIKAYDFDALQKPHALHYYTFMFFGTGTNGGEKGVWTAACSDNTDPISGTPVASQAIVYDDITVNTKSGVIGERADTLYLACVGAAVGKAGEWGYPAWDIGTKEFTTAVRSVRADYCGDGVSWTKKGNPLQIHDVYGYNDFSDPGAATEAIWTAAGAACLDTPRWIGTVSYSNVICNGAKVPTCSGRKLSDFSDATVWTKLP